MAIYLDNSATTPVRPEVIESMLAYLKESWGNPSSIHSTGRAALAGVKKAREQVAQLLNCEAEEVYFSSCGTMSNNAAILGRARFVEANQLGRHLITSQIEHPSVLGPAQYLESIGWKVTYLPVDREGRIDVALFKRSIGKETSIASIMWANNEIGTVQHIDELALLAKDAEIFFHTDAVQVAGKLPLDLRSVPVSALSLSGHKFNAPKGVGILYLRRQENIMPIIFGGGQEMGILPGTEAVANIVAIGKAAELAALELSQNCERLRRMQQIILDALSDLPNLWISGSANIEDRLPGHLSFYLRGAKGEALVMRADLKGVYISSGSACHKGVIEASRVMQAIGLSNEEAMGAIRVTAGRFNSEEECLEAAERLVEILGKTRASSRLAT